MIKPIAISLSLALFASFPAQACEGMGPGHSCSHHQSKMSGKGHKHGANAQAHKHGAKAGKAKTAAQVGAKAAPAQAAGKAAPALAAVRAATQAAPATRYGTLDAAAVRDLLAKEPRIQFIDVREIDEFSDARPQGARNLPLSTIDEWAPRLDKSAKYVLTCRSGRRSGMAAGKLADLGIANVHNMAGGILAWEKAGLPIEK